MRNKKSQEKKDGNGKYGVGLIKKGNSATAKKGKGKNKRRKYDRELMEKAIIAVKEDRSISVLQAAKIFGVPKSTLWDHFNGRCSKPFGGQTLFTEEEETKIADHIEHLSQVGYEYSRAQIRRYATSCAHFLKKSGQHRMLAYHWVLKFIGRNPRIKQILPDIRSERRNPTGAEIEHYYSELDRIMNKYDLKARPSLLYCVSDVVLGPHKGKPPKKRRKKKTKKELEELESKPSQANKLKSIENHQMTVLCCGSASGAQIPPYTIFKDSWFKNKMLDGGDIYGMGGTHSETGMCDSTIFMNYLEHHLLRHAITHDEGEDSDDEDSGYILVLYDGMLPYINTIVIEQALRRKIVLFVLPPHSKGLLRPIADGCFQNFKDEFDTDLLALKRRYPGKPIDRAKSNQLVCKTYIRALRPQYLGATFAGWGIYPFVLRPAVVDEDEDEEEDNSEEEDDFSGTDVEEEASPNLMTVIPKPHPPAPLRLENFAGYAKGHGKQKRMRGKRIETFSPKSIVPATVMEEAIDQAIFNLNMPSESNMIIEETNSQGDLDIESMVRGNMMVEEEVVEEHVVYDTDDVSQIVIKDEGAGDVMQYQLVPMENIQVVTVNGEEQYIVPQGSMVVEVPQAEVETEVTADDSNT